MLVTKFRLIGKSAGTDDAASIYSYLLNVDTGDTIELLNFTQQYQAQQIGQQNTTNITTARKL